MTIHTDAEQLFLTNILEGSPPNSESPTKRLIDEGWLVHTAGRWGLSSRGVALARAYNLVRIQKAIVEAAGAPTVLRHVRDCADLSSPEHRKFAVKFVKAWLKVTLPSEEEPRILQLKLTRSNGRALLHLHEFEKKA